MLSYTSSIRRIGLINSGMFDTLSINLDVTAVHLVGANNVGKTSLIALIQFLFFPTIKEMTFIKSDAESMGFYFRPEGSYILFEVRTISGSVRSVGIYGTGASDARVNFVFNGSFDLQDFLDADNVPIPLQRLQADFFSRDFARFDTFERYEEALLGLHTRGNYNVPMFDLSKTNFRLLRKLLQGLLRLDRIDAADVQQFLIRIVEKGAIRTRFNLVQDFEQKYRHINQLRIELRELEDLKPVMARYRTLMIRIAETDANHKRHAERHFHLSACYLARLSAEKERLAQVYSTQEARLDQLGQSIKVLTKREGEVETAKKELERTQKRFEELIELSRPHDEALIKKACDDLTHARVELQNALSATHAHQVADLKRQFNAVTRKHQGVLRQLRAKTVEQVWVEAGFDEAHRALLRFLISNDLAGLSASDVLADANAFITASAQVVDFLDAQGHFRGFGLDVPRSVWFVAEDEQEPLEARQTRLENDLATLRSEIDIAENRTRKQAELADLNAAIQANERILNAFAELRQLIDQWGRPATLDGELNKRTGELERIKRATADKEKESRSLRQAQHQTHSALQHVQAQWEAVNRDHISLEAFDGDAPPHLIDLPLDALRSEYDQVRGELADIAKVLKRLDAELAEPRADLEARYERAAADIPFERWLGLKADLADEIQGLERQLQREYDGIFTVVRAKLSKITQAYDTVDAQVAALNKAIRHVRISNIDRIGITLEKTALLDAIDQSVPGQLDLFAVQPQPESLEAAHAQIEAYFGRIKTYGNEINLKDMFRLKFAVHFNHQPKAVERYEIHRFESHGTETGVKIVIYLGLIGLLQERKNVVGTRIPFFLDEVGSIDADNLNQLIAYCTENGFLPIFASPEIRKDISHNYLFRRNGNRSELVSVIKISPRKQRAVQDEASNLVDHPA